MLSIPNCSVTTWVLILIHYTTPESWKKSLKYIFLHPIFTPPTQPPYCHPVIFLNRSYHGRLWNLQCFCISYRMKNTFIKHRTCSKTWFIFTFLAISPHLFRSKYLIFHPILNLSFVIKHMKFIHAHVCKCPYKILFIFQDPTYRS